MAGFVFPFFGYNDEKYGRMRRQDLMDLVLLRSRENDELKKELEALTLELEERRIIDAGAETIADAAMRRGKIYQLAHEIADSYVDSIRLKTEQQTRIYEEEKATHYHHLAAVEDEVNDRLMKMETEVNENLMNQESDSNSRIQQMEQESAQRIAAMEAEAAERMARQEAEVKDRLKKRESEVHVYCDQMLLEARSNSQKYWDDIQNQIKAYLVGQANKDTSRISEEQKSEKEEAADILEEKEDTIVNAAIHSQTEKDDPSSEEHAADEGPSADSRNGSETSAEHPAEESSESVSTEVKSTETISSEAISKEAIFTEAVSEVNSSVETAPSEDTSPRDHIPKDKRGIIKTPILEVEQSDLEELENLIVISN